MAGPKPLKTINVSVDAIVKSLERVEFSHSIGLGHTVKVAGKEADLFEVKEQLLGVSDKLKEVVIWIGQFLSALPEETVKAVAELTELSVIEPVEATETDALEESVAAEEFSTTPFTPSTTTPKAPFHLNLAPAVAA